MSPITTHVLDTALGRPAAGLAIVLARVDDRGAHPIAQGVTDDDGRIKDLMKPGSLEPGSYRMTFATGPYLAQSGRSGFYPEVTVTFTIEDATAHYHVPLLLSPYGYSTYRGS